MKFSLKILVMFLILFSSLSIFAEDDEVIEVIVEGMGAIENGDEITAKKTAMNDAKRNAVEEAMGTMISSQSITENYQLISDKIFTKTAGYIKKVDVISEGVDNGLFTVKIKAYVTKKTIKDDLAAINLLMQSVDYPRVMVLIDEYNLKPENKTSGISENVFIEGLLKKTFKIVDKAQYETIRQNDSTKAALAGDANEAKKLAMKFGAEIMIIGKAHSVVGTEVYGMKSSRATCNLKAIKADNGQLITSVNVSPIGQADLSYEAAGMKALEKVAAKASEKMINDIVKYWQDQANNGMAISIMVYKVGGFRNLVKIKKELGKLRGIKDLVQRSFSGGTAEFEANYVGKVAKLAEDIVSLEFNSFALDITGMTKNKVEVTVFKE